MKFIDCNASIGLGTVNREIVNHEGLMVREKVKQAKDSAELLAEMDRCGVDEAFVYHQAMFDTDPVYGNALILKETAGSERLHATFTILPSVTEEVFEPETLMKSMKAYNIRALRVFPHRNRFFLNKVTMGELLSVICEKRIPLFLTPYEEWKFIYEVLAEYPELTVIITNYGLWGSDRFVFPLVREYKNVYLDTSDYQMMNGYLRFVGKFGSDKLLFGTNYPMDNMGGPIATLVGSGLSASDIENIAHKNIERLISEVRL